MNNQVDLWSTPIEPVNEVSSGYFVVLAGINKRTDRQLYLSTYTDCDEWSISVVPSVMSYDRAQHMITKAKQDIEAKTKTGKTPQCPTFEIISLESCPLTSSERRALI